MTTESIEQFINGDQFTAIGYETEKEPEIVHPRIKRLNGQVYVYGRTSSDKKLRDIEIEEFVRLLASSAPGLAIGGNRNGGTGPQTSISFSKLDRLTFDASFQEFLAHFR